MHPFKSQAKADHSAKIKQMTGHYGSADPVANRIGPTNVWKKEGPEDAVSFGADSTMARARGDRPARKAVANDVATLATGGAVNRARGGRTKGKKGHTNVTVVVAPQGQQPAGPMGMAAPHPPPMPMPPPRPPMPPPGGPAPGAGGPGMPPPVLPPGMPPPGIMPPRAAGGRVGSLKDQGLDASDTVKEEPGITTKKGKVTGYDAGAVSGEGRLEKIKNYGRRESHKKAPVV